MMRLLNYLMKRKFLYVAVTGFALFGAFFIAVQSRIRLSVPGSTVISDARQLVTECIIFQASLAEPAVGRVILLEEVLARRDDSFRDTIKRRIEEGIIVFIPPTIPVHENPIIAIVLWEDRLVTVGPLGAQSYRRIRRDDRPFIRLFR